MGGRDGERAARVRVLCSDRVWIVQDKESVELAHRCTERELAEVREKLSATSRSLGACNSNCAQQESTVCSLRG